MQVDLSSVNCILDLKDLYSLSLKCQVEFNAEKCKVFRLGHGNNNFSYEMGGVLLNLWTKNEI